MPKRIIYCDECDKEFTVSFKGEEEPQFCPFCGSEVDADWNSDKDDES